MFIYNQNETIREFAPWLDSWSKQGMLQPKPFSEKKERAACVRKLIENPTLAARAEFTTGM